MTMGMGLSERPLTERMGWFGGTINTETYSFENMEVFRS